MTRSPYPLITVLAAAFGATAGAGPPPALAGAGLSSSERAVIRHVNMFRTRNGLPPVRRSWPLSRAADRHSRDMVMRGFFAHASSDGTSFDSRVRRYAGAAAVGETLATLPRGSVRAPVVVRMWRRSPPHRAILLDGRFRRIGVGRRAGSAHAVITADFATAR